MKEEVNRSTTMEKGVRIDCFYQSSQFTRCQYFFITGSQFVRCQYFIITGSQFARCQYFLIKIPNLPDVSRRTGGGCPGRRPLMTATWGSICSEVDIDGTCICFSTCVTITGNYWLFDQHLPHVEDTDWCSRSLHPAHFCVIHQHNSRPEQDQNEAEILFQPLPSD